MTKRILIAVVTAGSIAVLGLWTDRYLFIRRISHTDPKMFYRVIEQLTEATTDRERTEAIRSISSTPEMRDYRVALAADHIVLLHTKSLTSDAYLLAHQLGTSPKWSVGWLSGAKFSHIYTFTPRNFEADVRP